MSYTTLARTVLRRCPEEVQGRFEESDIQAYQAAFLSEQAQNASATYGAALLLGINAIYRSDMAGLQRAVDYLENKAQSYAFLQGTGIGRYMVETVRGYLLGLMMETERSALRTQGGADALAHVCMSRTYEALDGRITAKSMDITAGLGRTGTNGTFGKGDIAEIYSDSYGVDNPFVLTGRKKRR